MLEYFIVTLLPAAVILGIVLLLRLGRWVRSITRTARQESDGWRKDPSEVIPPDVLWRRAYRG